MFLMFRVSCSQSLTIYISEKKSYNIPTIFYIKQHKSEIRELEQVFYLFNFFNFTPRNFMVVVGGGDGVGGVCLMFAAVVI